MTISEFAAKYLAQAREALGAVDVAAVERVAERMLDVYERRGQLFVFGNGGSAAAASHFACDINKTLSYGLAKRFRMICLNDNVPTMLAYANDVSYGDVFVEQLENFLEPGDLVMGFSGSGNSPNVLKAVSWAREHGAAAIGVVGFDGGKLRELVDVALWTPVHDMQHVEDLQTVITHLITRALILRLHGRDGC